MGSHYIPVGKLKIDLALLDIACPAAGYTPELICPAAGYTPPEPDGSFTPPVETSTPGTNEIILLCSNEPPSMIYFRVYGNYTVEVWDASETILIQTSDHASGAYYTYNFPTANDGYFVIKIKGRGANLTIFRCHDTGGFATNWPIISAKLNTPSITSLTYAFASVKKIKSVEFVSEMNVLTSLSYFLYQSGIENFKFPPSLPAVNDMGYMFAQSKIRVLDLNFCNLPELVFMTFFVNNCQLIHQLTFNPTNVKKLRNLTSAFSYTYKLKEMFMDCELGESTTGVITLDRAFEFSSYEKITLFVGHLNYSAISCLLMFGNLSLLREMVFRGRTILEGESMGNALPSLEKVVCGTIFGISSHYPWSTSLVPESLIIDLPTDTQIGNLFVSTVTAFTNLKELNNKPNFPIEQSIIFTSYLNLLKRFDQPNLKVDRINIGHTGSVLEYVEIDWANSSYSWGVEANINVVITGKLSATEINRIFTALPAMNKRIQVSSNPGYATCDPTIATTKGWTVT